MFTGRTLGLIVSNWPQPSILALGTAAFGMHYGIANPTERPTAKAVEIMFDQAWKGGITTFDTAPAYGDAEDRLGGWIRRRGMTPHVATKLPALADLPDADVAEAVDNAIRESTRCLDQPPATYFAHGAADYLRPAIRGRLHDAAARGAIGAAGVSVYTEAEVSAVIAAGPPDAIQLPLNVFDQRMVSGGALAACASAGITVFARSIFLQGVLLMPADRLPPAFDAMRGPLFDFERICTETNTTRASAALRYVRDLPGVGSTIVGAYALEQLKALIAAANEPELTTEQRIAITLIAKRAPERLLDPRTWQPRS